ncbi:MAG: YkvA family protein [Candidatus Kariarchaeaceae archaeon]
MVRKKLKELKKTMWTFYFVYRHLDTPKKAKFLLGTLLAYFLSPIDLIPDFIPLIGHIDDYIILPIGIHYARKMVPEEIIKECEQKSADRKPSARSNWIAGGIIALFWAIVIFYALHHLRII